MGDVSGFGALQEPDVQTTGACRGEERRVGLPGEQPVLVAAADRFDHRDAVERHRGALALVVRVHGDDEQIALRLEASVDRDLQIAIKVVMHVEAVLVDELAECC